MKEDILEQIVDDYMQALGYFTIHNVKFRPAEDDPDAEKKQDSSHSDVDVIGFHPGKKGDDKVWVVSCKSWQVGFNPEYWINSIEQGKEVYGREAWRFFRELKVPKWGRALQAKVKEIAFTERFTHITAVTKLNGEKSTWEKYQSFSENINGNPTTILTLSDMLDEIWDKTGSTQASSEVGRLLQVIKASGWKIS